MPESKSRKKPAKVTQPDGAATPKGSTVNPRWLVPTMLTLMLVGLAWIIVFYMTQTKYPIPGIGNANLLIGFALVLSGFALTTRWK